MSLIVALTLFAAVFKTYDAEEVWTAIVSTHSYLCLDNAEGKDNNGNKLQQFACVADERNQQWGLKALSDANTYQLLNGRSGKCLDNGGSLDNGHAIWQWDCDPNNQNQAWRLVSKGQGTYSLVSIKSGKCMDITTWSKSNEAGIQQWDCSGGANQVFWLSTKSANFRAAKFDFATNKVRGVNLGGWLVLESWITPGLFNKFADPKPVDEWTFSAAFSSKSEAEAALRRHWDTWVTEEDIKTLASYGLNFLRIPVGYWAVKTFFDEPFVTGPQIDYLKKAVKWAQKYGLFIIIDLHGVPGFQNDFDNSGRQGNSVAWTQNANPFADSNLAKSIYVINELAKIFAVKPFDKTVASIQVVNEPQGYRVDKVDMYLVKQYYATAYAVLRATSNVNVMLHDAFLSNDVWKGFMQPPFYQNVIVDTHQYQSFPSPAFNTTGWSGQQHLDYTCGMKNMIAERNANLWTVVGEWSGATTDFWKPERRNWPTGYKAWLREYIEKQMDVYENGAGWVFWNFKTEKSDEWNYMLGVREGWIPNPPDARQYSC